MVLALLFGCSHGTLAWTSGSGPLETAFFLPVDDADTPTLYVALSNSYVASCKRPDLREDPDEALEELYLAVTRENTRVALLELNRYGVDTWQGLFPIASEDFQPNQLSGQDPFIAQGSWIGVDEAEVDRDDGLEQSYRVVDGTYVLDDGRRRLEADGAVDEGAAPHAAAAVDRQPAAADGHPCTTVLVEVLEGPRVRGLEVLALPVATLFEDGGLDAAFSQRAGHCTATCTGPDDGHLDLDLDVVSPVGGVVVEAQLQSSHWHLSVKPTASRTAGSLK